MRTHPTPCMEPRERRQLHKGSDPMSWMPRPNQIHTEQLISKATSAVILTKIEDAERTHGKGAREGECGGGGHKPVPGLPTADVNPVYIWQLLGARPVHHGVYNYWKLPSDPRRACKYKWRTVNMYLGRPVHHHRWRRPVNYEKIKDKDTTQKHERQGRYEGRPRKGAKQIVMGNSDAIEKQVTGKLEKHRKCNSTKMAARPIRATEYELREGDREEHWDRRSRRVHQVLIVTVDNKTPFRITWPLKGRGWGLRE